MMVAVAMSTVVREGAPNYLEHSLRELFERAGEHVGAVHVYVGSPDISGFRAAQEKAPGEIVLHETTDEDWFEISKLPPHRRARWNMTRTLSTQPDSEGLIILEDDVTFARNWIARLREGVEAAPEVGVVSGFTPTGLIPINALLGVYQPSFFGSLCLFFPKDLSTAAATGMREHVERCAPWLPYDVALNYTSVKFFGLLESCVEHVGTVSSLNGSLAGKLIKAAKFRYS